MDFAQISLGQEENPIFLQAKSAFEEGDYDKAATLLAPSLEKSRKHYMSDTLKEFTWEAYMKDLYLMGDIIWWQGKDYALTESLFLEFLDIISLRYGKSHKNYTDRLADLAALYYEIGKYEAAEKAYIEVLETDKDSNVPITQNTLSTKNNLAVLYDAMGKFYEAENLYRKIISDCKILLGTQHSQYASALANLAALYQRMGRYHEAIDLTEEAMHIHLNNKGERSRQYVTSLNNLAMLHYSIGHLQEAKSYLSECLKLKEEILGTNHIEYLISASNLASIYLEANEPDKAILQTTKVTESYLTLVDSLHPSFLNTLSNHASSLALLGRLNEAKKITADLMRLRATSLGKQHPEYVESLFMMAGITFQMRDIQKAETLFLESIACYEELIQNYFPGLSEKEQEAFYNALQKKFEIFANFVSKYPSPELHGKLYNIALFSKALLLASIRKNRESIYQLQDQNLNEKFHKWKILRETLANSIYNPTLDFDDLSLLLDSLKQEINSLEKELSRVSINFNNSALKPQWEHVQEKLQKDEAAIEIMRLKKYDIGFKNKSSDTISYAILIIIPDSKAPHTIWLNNGKLLEERLLKAYKRDMSQGTNESNAYKYLWEPIEDAIKGIKKVYLSADGVYLQINPATLWSSKTNKYLTDEVTVSLLTSTRELLELKQTSSLLNNNQAVLIGNPDFKLVNNQYNEDFVMDGTKSQHPKIWLQKRENISITDLPGTQEEIAAIHELLTHKKYNVEVFLREGANEINIKKLKSPQILHLATHGYFGDQHPFTHFSSNPLFKSGLFFSGSAISNYTPEGSFQNWQGEDGILTAYEVVGLDLENTELVVLSACETGLGEIVFGEGVDGLQRAFKKAGAKSILMSLWKVNDWATKELMVNFYTLWLGEGLNKHDALRTAQNMMKKEYPDPYYWGGFILLGL